MIQDIRNMSDIFTFIAYLNKMKVRFTLDFQRDDNIMIVCDGVGVRIEIEFGRDNIK